MGSQLNVDTRPWMGRVLRGLDSGGGQLLAELSSDEWVDGQDFFHRVLHEEDSSVCAIIVFQVAGHRPLIGDEHGVVGEGEQVFLESC